MQRTALHRRLARRELHRSRSVAVSVALVVTILVLAWVGTESVLAALGDRALLVAPRDVVDAALGPDQAWAGAVYGAAAVAVIIGIVLIVIALAPGRRDRRTVPRDRAVVIVDDRIVAATAAHAARLRASVPESQVEAWVTRRKVGVRVTPTTGVPVDAGAVEQAVAERLTDVDPTLARNVTVRVAETGALA